MWLTTSKFNQLLLLIDRKNNFDLESFVTGLEIDLKIKNQNLIDDIIDFMVFDMGVSSDAEIPIQNQNQMKKIVDGINLIMKENRLQ